VEAYRADRAGQTQSVFAAWIDGNVIPRIGPIDSDGWTEEERKMRGETRKILGLPGLPVAATCVRVPVEVGHAVSATVRTKRPLSVENAAAALESMPGVRVYPATDGDPMPRSLAGTDEIGVGRLRRDPDRANLLHMWIVADNLRKGAATNAVQIADAVLRG
jgi:aspartate-semialdehyde dehydrogenase